MHGDTADGPPTKRFEVAVVLDSVVTGVPQRNTSVDTSSAGRTNSRSPTPDGRINSDIVSGGATSGDEFREVLAVGGVVTAPATTRAWVGFDVEPELAHSAWGNGCGDLLHGSGGTDLRTNEGVP